MQARTPQRKSVWVCVLACACLCVAAIGRGLWCGGCCLAVQSRHRRFRRVRHQASCCAGQTQAFLPGAHVVGLTDPKGAITSQTQRTHHSRPPASCRICRQLHRRLHVSRMGGQCCCHVPTPALDERPQHAAAHIAGIKRLQQRLWDCCWGSRGYVRRRSVTDDALCISCWHHPLSTDDKLLPPNQPAPRRLRPRHPTQIPRKNLRLPPHTCSAARAVLSPFGSRPLDAKLVQPSTSGCRMATARLDTCRQRSRHAQQDDRRNITAVARRASEGWGVILLCAGRHGVC